MTKYILFYLFVCNFVFYYFCLAATIGIILTRHFVFIVGSPMKHLKHFFFAIVFLCATQLFAQQTYFNVPNSRVTGQGDLYLQVNAFLTDGLNRTQLNGMYGVSKDTEIGLNVMNNKNNENWIGLNAQHRQALTSEHNLTVGGTYYFTENNAFILYGLVTANKLLSNANINAGIYYGNEGMFGESTIGLMAGIDYPVLNDKIRVKGEIMTGNHWMNGLNIGGQYSISKNMLAGVGINLINFNEKGASPFILQLHYNM